MYEQRPLVVYVLIIVNAIVWLTINLLFTTQAALSAFLLTFGVVPIFLLNGQNLFSLLSYMFVHVDFLHIFLNMFSLFLFGRDVEEYLGSKKFLAVYFFSGIVAAVFHIFYFVAFLSLNCSPYIRPIPVTCLIPSIGASGAIFGIMGSYLIFFPTRRLAAFLYFIPVIAPAYVIIIGFILIQTFFMLTTPFSTIAYTAHVGGFVAGLIASLPFRRRRPEWMLYG
ncbi:MAG: rhomboid family intramembrane serine protease [Candidatus Caldarchaeum sp.]|nr:rhomboid family intramembrane serine protease [Candidatus Caldarchaeum sp.]